jgi:Zn-dependent protease with chaperone function
MAIGSSSVRIAAVTILLCTSMASLGAQTVIKLPKNKYTPDQDVKIGREAAAQVRKQYPIINDEHIARYLTTLGDRLVAAAPPELKQPVYEYSFTPVNLKEINAFALPGGPMFVHRGMFDAAASEGEVAGVMAHELSHVLLRHGTANATKAENPWLQLGQMAGAIGGAVVGGAAGSAIAQGSQFGLGTLMLRYSRDYEKQADILGAQIMARAGYDPRALAHMFETIEAQMKGSGASDPQWLSDHPNPGNRTEYITKEATLLTIAGTADDSGFTGIKTAFASLGPAKAMGDLAQARSHPNGDRGLVAGSSGGDARGTLGQPIPPPSTTYRTIKAGTVFEAAIPSNWTAQASKNTIRVVPENGSGQTASGQDVFTHGIEFGVVPGGSRDLQQATTAFLRAVAQGNPGLQMTGPQQTVQLSNRVAIGTPLVNPSPLGGQERIALYTAFLADGSLFYYLTVAPENDVAALQETFRRVGGSIHLTDVR